MFGNTLPAVNNRQQNVSSIVPISSLPSSVCCWFVIPFPDRNRRFCAPPHLPPCCEQDTLEFSIPYEARFLHADDFPPDANYGFDMLPAVVDVVAVLPEPSSTQLDTTAHHGRICQQLTAPPSQDNPVRFFSIVICWLSCTCLYCIGLD